jgi:hypothetical protein
VPTPARETLPPAPLQILPPPARARPYPLPPLQILPPPLRERDPTPLPPSPDPTPPPARARLRGYSEPKDYGSTSPPSKSESESPPGKGQPRHLSLECCKLSNASTRRACPDVLDKWKHAERIVTGRFAHIPPCGTLTAGQTRSSNREFMAKFREFQSRRGPSLAVGFAARSVSWHRQQIGRAGSFMTSHLPSPARASPGR